MLLNFSNDIIDVISLAPTFVAHEAHADCDCLQRPWKVSLPVKSNGQLVNPLTTEQELTQKEKEARKALLYVY